MHDVRVRNFPFNHDDARYRCCCYSVHVKHGALAIAIISSFFIISNLILKTFGLSNIGWNWELFLLAVDTTVILSLFYGIISEKAALLQPFVVLNMLTISFLVLLSIFFINAIYDSHSYAAEYIEFAISERMQSIASIISVPEENVVATLSIFITIAISVAALIHCWFMIVIIKCARYFRDLEPVKQNFMKGYKADWFMDSDI